MFNRQFYPVRVYLRRFSSSFNRVVEIATFFNYCIRTYPLEIQFFFDRPCLTVLSYNRTLSSILKVLLFIVCVT